MASELLSTIQGEIDARLNELRPLLAEYEQLLGAVDALLDTEGGSVAPAPKKPRATRTVRAPRGSAAGVIAQVVADEPVAATSPDTPDTPAVKPKPKSPKPKSPKPERAQRGAAREAILGALEHGSHTIAELVVVTAMSAPNLNGNLRRLAADGTVVKTEREGKTAYALPAAA